MNRAIQWMAGNHVAANLLMLLFIIGGLVIGSTVKQEVFPEVVLDRVRVEVAYPGAAPDEVEEGIILQVEEAISGVDGIKEVDSTAAEGYGVVTAVVREGEDEDQVLQDIKSEVDRITTFPGEAEKPVISKVLNRREVISAVVYGEVSDLVLREQAEKIRDDLLEFDRITQVELNGVRPYEISIEIPQDRLRQYQITMDEVARAVRRASVDLPGGAVEASGGEVLIRTRERRYHGPGYADITIKALPDGTALKLGRVAEIRDGFEDTDQAAFFNGKPAAMVAVYRVGDQKPTVIADLVKKYVEQRRAQLPADLGLAVWDDSSEHLESRMKLLLRNAMLGLFLVFAVLSLFLQMRLALWVMLGIPISFLGALLFMPVLDVSINMISLFAFIMALGVVVDDAIVIGENIFEHRRRGQDYLTAAVAGAREVGIPVTFSILTSVTAFLPLVFISGSLGKFIKVIPLVVISILLISLVESLFILPAHLSFGRPRRNDGSAGVLERMRLAVVGRVERFVAGPYRRLLDGCLEYRYAVLAASLALLMVTVGIVRGGVIKFHFMPEVEGDRVTATLTMPRGTPPERTAAVQQLLVARAEQVVAEFDRRRGAEESSLRQIYSVVGGTMRQGGPTGGGSGSGAHLAEVALLLTSSEKRGYPSSEITGRWRRAVGEIPGVDSLTFRSDLMRLGADIDVRLAHEDFGVLTAAAARLKQALAAYPGVGDIEDNYPEGKKEIRARLKPAARTLGITEEELGRQLRGAFYGAEALRLQRGRNEVKVMVRYPEEQRQSLWHLENMLILTPAGGEIPLNRAAYLDEGRGYSVINRSDRKRVINVTAGVDSREANAEEILDDLGRTTLAGLLADYPGLSYQLEGEQKERRESLGSMLHGFVLALFVIYALLAIPFRSYTQPLLIMAAIPFGMVGAVAGHLLMGFNLSMLSLFGIVALSGVVVNDSLLMIDRVNHNRQGGEDIRRAVLEAGRRRFRPIILTSFTTFFGLTPMILETSVQAQFLIPMAISLGFGILFATAIILILIPTLYLVLEDLIRLSGLGSGRVSTID